MARRRDHTSRPVTVDPVPSRRSFLAAEPAADFTVRAARAAVRRSRALYPAAWAHRSRVLAPGWRADGG